MAADDVHLQRAILDSLALNNNVASTSGRAAGGAAAAREAIARNRHLLPSQSGGAKASVGAPAPRHSLGQLAREGITPSQPVRQRRRDGGRPGAAAGLVVTSAAAERASSASALPADQKKDPIKVPAGEDPALMEMLLRDVVDRSPGVSFDDVASLADAKQLLNEAIVLPLVLPEFFTGIREPWRGVLLFGPPGTGKTMLAKAAASVAGVTFLNCATSTLTSKWRGESEKLVRALFALARANAPAVIFIDEVDALVGSRGDSDEHEASRRFRAELLTQMDGIPSAVSGGGALVIVLATTNRPWDLDEALRRRLEKRIHVPLPDEAARKELIQLQLRGVSLAEDVSADWLAASTAGLSGADLKLLCRDASMMPMRRLIASRSQAEIMALKDSGQLAGVRLSRADFEESLRRTRPSVDAAELPRYEHWAAQHGST